MGLFANFKKHFKKEKSVRDLLDIADEGMQADLDFAKKIDEILLVLSTLKEGRQNKKVERIIRNNFPSKDDIVFISHFLESIRGNIETLINIMKIDIGANKKEEEALNDILELTKSRPELNELASLCQKRLDYRVYILKLIPPFDRLLIKFRDMLKRDRHIIDTRFDYSQVLKDFKEQKPYVKKLLELENAANKAASFIKGYSDYLKNISLADKNGILEDYAIRSKGYIFSSKVRDVLFSISSLEKRREVILEVKRRINYLLRELEGMRVSIHYFYEELKRTNLFVQKRHFRLAKRFFFNSFTNSKRMLRILNYLRNDIVKLELANNPKQFQNLFHSIEDRFKVLLELFKENKVYLIDIQGRLQIERNLVHNYTELKESLLDKSQLLTGDLLLSFKSHDYIKKKILSRAIYHVTGSQVTHAMMAARLFNGVKIIDSLTAADGVSLRDFQVLSGEVFIVLRPKISSSQRAKILRIVREYVHKKAKYAKQKLVGVFLTLPVVKLLNLFSRGYRSLPNIFATMTSTVFCSEFVNQVFKEAGVLLTPKSNYSSMVSPSDIVASPVVEYIGLIFEESQRSEEIILKYLGDVKV